MTSGVPQPGPKRGFDFYAYLVADGTPIDGSATDIVVTTWEGPFPTTVSFLRGIIADAASGGHTVLVGQDHGEGILYSIPGDSDPWVPVDVRVGDTVMFLGEGMPAWGFNTAGFLSQPVIGSPATQMNGINANTSRLNCLDVTPPANYIPVTEIVPNDPMGYSIEAHRLGIDNALGDRSLVTQTASGVATVAGGTLVTGATDVAVTLTRTMPDGAYTAIPFLEVGSSGYADLLMLSCRVKTQTTTTVTITVNNSALSVIAASIDVRVIASY